MTDVDFGIIGVDNLQMFCDLEHEEGVKYEFYLDSEGNLTCGIGHLCVIGGKVPEEAVIAFFNEDTKDVIADYLKLPKAYRDALNTEPRRRVICQMLFNLGRPRTLRFKNMWKALLEGDYNKAGDEILDSDAGRKLKNRYTRLRDIMKRG